MAKNRIQETNTENTITKVGNSYEKYNTQYIQNNIKKINNIKLKKYNTTLIKIMMKIIHS